MFKTGSELKNRPLYLNPCTKSRDSSHVTSSCDMIQTTKMATKTSAAAGSVVIFITFLCIAQVVSVKYKPTWDSLDSRPLPSWYDDAKIGIFIHWGVFSVPSFGSEWFWYNWKTAKQPGIVDFMQRNYRPGFTYADFAPKFTTEFYNAEQWANIFNASGAR